MPQSKKRHHHHHHQHHQQQHHVPADQQKSVKPNRLINAGMIFFAVLGFLISYFVGDGDISWLLAGTAGGAILGYFFAKQMNKTFSK